MSVQGRILEFVRAHPGCSRQEIERAINHAHGVANALGKLKQRDLVFLSGRQAHARWYANREQAWAAQKVYEREQEARNKASNASVRERDRQGALQEKRDRNRRINAVWSPAPVRVSSLAHDPSLRVTERTVYTVVPAPIDTRFSPEPGFRGHFSRRKLGDTL